MLAGVLLLLHPAAVRAQIIWVMPTEYPQSAMPGLGVCRAAASTIDWRKDACSCNAQLLGGVIDTSSLPSLQCRLRFWGKLPRAALWFHNGRLAGVDYHQQALNFSRA
jgi:hypothetical protein